jgi:hypothetical protein
MKLGIVEAAAAIKETVELNHLPPEEVHQLRFLQGVATELGMDHTPQSLHSIAAALRQHDIEIHSGHEYPKSVKRKFDGSYHIADNPEHEAEIVNWTPPEPDEEVHDQFEATAESDAHENGGSNGKADDGAEVDPADVHEEVMEEAAAEASAPKPAPRPAQRPMPKRP